MEIEVLGAGNAFTSRRYNTSFLIRSRQTMLIDGSPGLFRLLKEREIPKESIEGVIVTHVHGDHVGGLETLVLWRRHHLNSRTRIYTSAPVFEKLEQAFFPSFSTTFEPSLKKIVRTRFQDYVEWIEFDEEEPNAIDSELKVEIRHNWHPTPTLGLKLIGVGGTVGISGDTCFRPRLLTELHAAGVISDRRYRRLGGDWLWESGLIYHEADRSGPASPHTQEEDLLALPPEVREKIRLVHVPDEFEEGRLPIAEEGEIARIEEGGIRLIRPPV